MQTSEQKIEQRFTHLAQQWEHNTAHLSSMTKKVVDPAYQSIIDMGADVLPILFRELKKSPNWWFWALREITETDPTSPEDAGNLHKMTNAWLKWAEENDYL